MKLFLDDEDFNFFLKTIKLYKAEYNFEIYAYCLMSNHFHILLKDNGMNLPLIMDSIESIYACYFIEKYDYKGRIFESRFKSIVITSSLMMLREHRYINRNSVAAGIVADVMLYPWSALTQVNDKYNLIDFNFIESLYKENCNIGYFEYLNSDVDDLWLNAVEICRLDDAEAFIQFNYLRKTMNISMEEITTPVYNEKMSNFIYSCKIHCIMKRQLTEFTNLSIYKINKLLKIRENLI